MIGKRIMVADDDIDVLGMLDALLSEEGYQTILCSEGEDAYEIARRTQPDLVILDLMMGDAETGWRTMTLLRGDPSTADLPIILASGNTDFLRVRAGVLRMKRCVAVEKPFAVEELLAIIAHELETPREQPLATP